jgi:hypothetical protein
MAVKEDDLPCAIMFEISTHVLNLLTQRLSRQISSADEPGSTTAVWL